MFYIIDIIDIMQTQEQEGDGVILLDHLMGITKELKESLVLSHFLQSVLPWNQGFPCKWCACKLIKTLVVSGRKDLRVENLQVSSSFSH